jgi:4'-phosphopantetheinyl transferase
MAILSIEKSFYSFFYVCSAWVKAFDINSFEQTLPAYVQRYANTFYKSQDRLNYLLGRYLLKNCFPKYFNWEQLKTNSYGKPYIENSTTYFNIAHSQNWVCLVLSPTSHIGVDIELVVPTSYDNFNSCFSSQEWRNILQSMSPLHTFYQYWTQKESVLKADGHGLNIEMQDVKIEGLTNYISSNSSLLYLSEFITLPEEPLAVVCVSYAVE